MTTTATVVLILDNEQFEGSLEESTASVRETADTISTSFDGASTEVAGAMDEMAESASASFEEMSAAAAEAGEATGQAVVGGIDSGMAEVEGSITESTGVIVDEMTTGGLEAGERFSAGVAEGMSDIDAEMTTAGVEAGEGFDAGAMEGMEGLDAEMTAAGAEAGADAGAATSEGFMDGLKEMMGPIIAAVAGAVSIDFAEKMQSADTAIANSANISEAAAKKIGTSFLGTAGSVEYSGETMAKAYSTVAGKLGNLQGHALSAKQALTVMTQASQLAEATGVSLGSATSDVAQMMQSYQLKTKTAAMASNDLYETSRITGTSLTSVDKALAKIKTKLGALAPTLKTTSALMADLAAHGETGRASMSALTTGFTAFLKPATDVATATNDMNAAMKTMTPTLRGYAKAVQNGTLAGTALVKVTTTMTSKQAALWSTFTSANTAIDTSKEKYSELGISVTKTTGKLKSMSTIVGQLHEKVAGESAAEATATLTAMGFGSAAAKLAPIAIAGAGAFDKERMAVTQATGVHKAAAKEMKDFHAVMETVVAAVEDVATKVGQLLMPAFTAFVGVLDPVIKSIAKFITWLTKGSKPALAVAAAIGVVLMPVIAAMGIATVKSFVEMGAKMAEWVISTISDAATGAASFLGIGTSADEASAEVALSMDGMSESMDTAAPEIEAAGDEIGEGIDASFGVIGIAVMAVVAVATLLVTHWKTVETVLKDVWDAIKSAAITAWDFIKEHLSIIATAIATVILGPIGGLVVEIATHWDTVKSYAEDVWNDIKGFLSDVWDDIKTVFEDATIVGIIMSHWTQIKADATTAWNDVVSFIQGVPGDIERIFTGAGTWLLDVGKQIIDGLKNGIEDAEQDVIGAVKKVGSDITNAFKSVLSIFSPSKVFHDLGTMIPLGVAEGIAEGSATAIKATQTMAHSLATVPFKAPTLTPLTAAGGSNSSLPVGAMAAGVGGTAAPAGGGSGPITVNVNAQTNASATDIATEVGWTLRTKT